jgi:nucleoside-diphosphate-sugar epimerase
VPGDPRDDKSYPSALDRGARLFNREKFFEAHEVWEEIWKRESGDRRLLLHGLIQAAAAYVKWRRGEPSGTVKLLQRASEKLRRVREPNALRIAGELAASLEAWIAAIASPGAHAVAEHPPFPRVSIGSRKSDATPILITGAAGNLGSLLARHLLPHNHDLRLMYHRRLLPDDLARAPNVEAFQADLANPQTVAPAVAGVGVVVHFAGVLFAPRPERFLPVTNTLWFGNLVDAALDANVGRVILISFPHVEGPTSFERPATGRLDRDPISSHARTRLEEERLLFERTRGTQTAPVVLRLGMVYGRGILMIEAARWLARRRLLAVWPEPTMDQLISTIDAMRAIEAAVTKPGIEGVYHVGDEKPVTLQYFLDEACRTWGYPRPWRAPFWSILAAAGLCELFATMFRTKSPLTRDFVRIGRVPHWGDTRRFRRELLPKLEYPNFEAGISTL